jgi:hypothetical protein
MYCDPEVMRYVTGGPLVGSEAVRAALAKYAQAQEEHGFSSWAIVERKTPRPPCAACSSALAGAQMCRWESDVVPERSPERMLC